MKNFDRQYFEKLMMINFLNIKNHDFLPLEQQWSWPSILAHTDIYWIHYSFYWCLDLNLKFNWFDQCDYPVEHVPICKQVNQSKKKKEKRKKEKTRMLSTSQWDQSKKRINPPSWRYLLIFMQLNVILNVKWPVFKTIMTN